MKRIKSTAIIISLIILISTLSSCIAPEDKVLNSLGECRSCEFYTCGGFQDYTDYAKYYYDPVDFIDNEYFSIIEQSGIDALNEHLDDFESWIETYREGDASREIVVNYDFDRSLIDSEDYLYIDSEKHTWDDGYTSLVNYDVYFFDIQTNTLYYFHNNIQASIKEAQHKKETTHQGGFLFCYGVLCPSTTDV